MIRPTVFVVLAMTFMGAAFAHTGVKNAAVKARMDSMSAIAAELKTLGLMARGTNAFNSEKARAAAVAIAKHAAETPMLFLAEEDDPMSEAKAEIWDNFEDFSRMSQNLEALASKLSASISVEGDLVLAMKSLGDACQACHKSYRE